MLSIGEFARYLGVSVRMLRHYDALGLLVPAHVDPSTGYRYYTAAQLDRGNRLVALKELGFSLNQIGPVLDAQLTVPELRAMLTLRRAQVAEQIVTDQVRLAEIERRLRSIEGGSMSALEFVEKPLPAVRIAQLVESVADQPDIGPTIGPMFQRLVAALSGSGIALDQPAIAWYRPSDDCLQIAAAFPVTLTEVPADLAGAGVQVATLDAAAKAVAVLHHGGMETIGDTWQALARHIEDKGYRSAGTAREVYLHMPMDADSAGWVTELQQPVTRGS
jgi:DNA-binding transcriptional MerR regulator/effector-binding domain-containing protein